MKLSRKHMLPNNVHLEPRRAVRFIFTEPADSFVLKMIWHFLSAV